MGLTSMMKKLFQITPPPAELTAPTSHRGPKVPDPPLLVMPFDYSEVLVNFWPRQLHLEEALRQKAWTYAKQLCGDALTDNMKLLAWILEQEKLRDGPRPPGGPGGGQ